MGDSKTFIAVAVAMTAFAGNSVLGRMALLPGDGPALAPSQFTALRLVSGAMVLALLVVSRRQRRSAFAFSVPGAMSLFVYAAAFSVAYVRLGAGAGALVLFAFVQMTMLSVGFVRGERLSTMGVVGLGMAVAGTVVLVAPSADAPDATAMATMGVAGVAWGIYSLLGQKSADALGATAGNFVLATPLAALLWWTTWSAEAELPVRGVMLAVASGAVTSGLGYAIWYRAVRGLTATAAATVQLSVPVIASVGGAVFIAEMPSLRLVVSTVLVLVGIRLTLRRAQSDDG